MCMQRFLPSPGEKTVLSLLGASGVNGRHKRWGQGGAAGGGGWGGPGLAHLMKVVFPVEYWPTSKIMGLLSKSASSRAGE